MQLPSDGRMDLVVHRSGCTVYTGALTEKTVYSSLTLGWVWKEHLKWSLFIKIDIRWCSNIGWILGRYCYLFVLSFSGFCVLWIFSRFISSCFFLSFLFWFLKYITDNRIRIIFLVGQYLRSYGLDSLSLFSCCEKNILISWLYVPENTQNYYFTVYVPGADIAFLARGIPDFIALGVLRVSAWSFHKRHRRVPKL